MATLKRLGPESPLNPTGLNIEKDVNTTNVCQQSISILSTTANAVFYMARFSDHGIYRFILMVSSSLFFCPFIQDVSLSFLRYLDCCAGLHISGEGDSDNVFSLVILFISVHVPLLPQSSSHSPFHLQFLSVRVNLMNIGTIFHVITLGVPSGGIRTIMGVFIFKSQEELQVIVSICPLL